MFVSWNVEVFVEFAEEVRAMPKEVRKALFVKAGFLEARGPQLSRPHVDTLKGSAYTNMKELRFDAEDGVWRVAFAFDPKRNAILLVAGDKAGVSEKAFYKRLIAKADTRYEKHLNILKSKE
jgi:hypothetical protein